MDSVTFYNCTAPVERRVCRRSIEFIIMSEKRAPLFNARSSSEALDFISFVFRIHVNQHTDLHPLSNWPLTMSRCGDPGIKNKHKARIVEDNVYDGKRV